MRPLQPISKDANGCFRFEGNSVVQHLLDNGPFDMNALAIIDFPREDREQFAMLIGYSLSGFGELSYVSDETYEAATKEVIKPRPDPETTNDLRQCECGEDINVNFQVQMAWSGFREKVGMALCSACYRVAPFRVDGFCNQEEVFEKAYEAWNERVED